MPAPAGIHVEPRVLEVKTKISVHGVRELTALPQPPINHYLNKGRWMGNRVGKDADALEISSEIAKREGESRSTNLVFPTSGCYNVWTCPSPRSTRAFGPRGLLVNHPHYFIFMIFCSIFHIYFHGIFD